MDHSLADIWTSMSIPVKVVMIFMLGMSIYMAYRVIDRVVTYAKAAGETVRFVLGLREQLKNGRYDEVQRVAQSFRYSPVAKVVGAGTAAYRQGQEALAKSGPADVGDFDLVDSVNRAIERVKEREVSSLRKGLAGIGTVATATPFVGLFGTVIGIINAFALLKGNATIEVIGPAIAEALYATAGGLLIAIFAAMGFNYCTTRVEELTVDMNDVSSEFLDHILREGRS
ncbi:MAG: MotA/TolQ/ExbB proton channel family protein [Myxococcales bacterium]|nr:MotA/TolQ/ExbB proton channel family protein [Myxococcales bacterium]